MDMYLDAAEMEHLSHYGTDENWTKTMDGRVIAKLCGQVVDLHEDRKWVAGFSFLGGFLAAGALFTWVL